MTPEDRAELERLCLAVQQEHDPARLIKLLEDLNVFLERRAYRLTQFGSTTPKTPTQS
jgi:hypothetical protein